MNYDPTITDILNRNTIKTQIAEILQQNDQLPPNSVRNSIFVYGKSGVGKTTFIKHILDEFNYDHLLYDAADIRNKSTIEQIMKASVCTNNVFHMLHNKSKKIVIVMDEIEGMNNGDRGGINALIRLIRPKQPKPSNANQKTQKQTPVEMFHCNLICICNHNIDKKISEIMKLCSVIHLSPPTSAQMLMIAQRYIQNENNAPDLETHQNATYLENIISHSHNDLRKLLLHANLLKNSIRHSHLRKNNHQAISLITRNIFSNSFNVNVKNVIYKLIKSEITLNENEIFTSETNRTMIALIWHENVIDYIKNDDVQEFIHMYQKFLENMCIGDYIDRITFQKQIWQLNEMTSFIKVLYNQSLLKNSFDKTKVQNMKISDIRFTKVLTKYSSEYNNYIFLQTMCEKFNIDRNDLISIIACATYKHCHMTSLIQELSTLKYKITLIELKRLHKFINKIDYNTSKSTNIALLKNASSKKTQQTPPRKNTTPCNHIQRVSEKDETKANASNEPLIVNENNENNENAAFILSDEEEEMYQNYQTFESTTTTTEYETSLANDTKIQ